MWLHLNDGDICFLGRQSAGEQAKGGDSSYFFHGGMFGGNYANRALPTHNFNLFRLSGHSGCKLVSRKLGQAYVVYLVPP